MSLWLCKDFGVRFKGYFLFSQALNQCSLLPVKLFSFMLETVETDTSKVDVMFSVIKNTKHFLAFKVIS